MNDRFGHAIVKGDLFAKWNKDRSSLMLCIALEVDSSTIKFSEFPVIMGGLGGPYFNSFTTLYSPDYFALSRGATHSPDHILKLYKEHSGSILNQVMSYQDNGSTVKMKFGDFIKAIHKIIFNSDD